ncbi:MAG: lysophospholipid acyltransferase family protein [bacterium]
MGSDLLARERIQDRLDRIDIDFNEHGFDKYGVSIDRLKAFAPTIASIYKHYFSVTTQSISNVPSRGRVMLISNHAGGLPIDGLLISTACILELEPPRLLHAMVDKFMNNIPFLSSLIRELGQMIGLPSNAKSVLDDDRALLIFPEGAEGTGKLYFDRYKLIRFGTGFMRIALETNTPIVPVGFVGSEEMIPSVFKIKRLARWLGVPYIPIPPQLLPIPLPVNCRINFGEPMMFDGDGDESDEVIKGYVDEVKQKICDLLNEGLRHHESKVFPDSEATIERWESNHVNN